MAGARYIKLDLDLYSDIGASTISSSSSDASLDGIIGAQVTVDLSDRWILSL